MADDLDRVKISSFNTEADVLFKAYSRRVFDGFLSPGNGLIP